MLAAVLLAHVAVVAPADARACGACHVAEYAAWRGSAHAQAAANRLWVASWKREPMGWCLGCHAPAARDGERGDGVDCASCHVRDGAIGSAREAARPEACARCHQFDFPGTAQPMQDTVAEWRATPAAREGRGCVSCHAPGGDHGFAGGHSPALLRRTVRAEVRLLADGRARVTLRASGAAHRVPTGDPFRRFYVELCAEADCDEPLARPRFGRVFGADGRLARDTTIPAPTDGDSGERTIEVALGERPRAIHWRLIYAYAAASSEPDLDGADRELELARGIAVAE